MKRGLIPARGHPGAGEVKSQNGRASLFEKIGILRILGEPVDGPSWMTEVTHVGQGGAHLDFFEV